MLTRDFTCDNFFSLSILSWRRRIQTYSLPAPCCDLTKRVARSIQTIKPPVTLGSRVPEWPVFSTRRIRLIQATTSWEEGLAGYGNLVQNSLNGVFIFYLVKVDDTITNVFTKRTLQGRRTAGDRSVVTSTNIELIVVLSKGLMTILNINCYKVS